MKRQLLMVTLAGALCVATATAASAQDEGYTVGHTDFGPVIGLGGLGGADIAIGGRFEKAIKQLPDLGNGIIGIQASVDWYSFDQRFLGFGSSFGYTYVPISVIANYHFQIQTNKKWDPFVGIGLGYQRVSYDCEINGIDYCDDDLYGGGDYGSGLYFVGRVGVRYFWRPRLALYADAGAGAANLHVGVMYKFR